MPAPIRVNETVTTDCGQKFKTIAKHRGTALTDISKWTISLMEEYHSFMDALIRTKEKPKNYNNLTLCWGIHINGNRLAKLGENTHSNDIKIAKFTKHIHNTEWHGYPADYQYRPQDIPASKFLSNLKTNNYLTKSNVNKILQGKPCNL